MKGISTILVVILVVIIVVALISLMYTFATSLFGTAVTGAEEETEAIVMGLGTQFRIEMVGNNSETEVMVYIRNIGTGDIDMNDVAVFLDGNRITDIGCC